MKKVFAMLCIITISFTCTACFAQASKTSVSSIPTTPNDNNPNHNEQVVTPEYYIPPIINITPNTNTSTSTTAPPKSLENRLQGALAAIKASIPATDTFIAYSPQNSATGTINIRVIIPGEGLSEQRDYLCFADSEAYKLASAESDEDRRIDECYTLLIGTKSTYPVVHPETVGCVLFEGYTIWR